MNQKVYDSIVKTYKNGSYRAAIEKIRTLDDISKYSMEIINLIALCAIRLKQHIQARRFLDGIIAHDRNFERRARARIIKGQIYIRQQEWSAGEKYFLQMLDSGFRWPKVYTSLGLIYINNNKVEKAIKTYKTILARDRENTTALNSLGFILVDNEVDIDNGLVFCQKAVSKNPSYSPFLDSLGWAWHKNKQRSKAIQTLRQALILDPENSIIRKHLETATTG